jgi:hypothetical protein
MNHLIQRAAPALTLCLGALVAAHAQGSAAPQATTGAALPYRSAFADYTPWQDTRPGDWRALNDAVKGDSMSGMDMAGMKDMGDMKGMSGKAGHDGMPAMPAPAHAEQVHAPAKAASTPAMPGPSAHSGHDMTGGHR